ncbi:TetR/AcrR family transcriptional regulator [Hephaestia mangrovi]|uniref:TetR/AcrR family transcriptional regulator n=1 Tax=Hephaestia mangrovi TaxID=2873268 RepID=UPI002107E447|nr:TetR/AcrR family transcriptional regulator [Hephaestia mangrovi]
MRKNRRVSSGLPEIMPPSKKTSTKRRTKAEQRAATVEQILDSAEELFAGLGFFGVAVSDVAEKIGSHPALVHYYFKSKQELFDAVFERRVGEAVRSRTEALDQYEASCGDNPTVEGALKAYYVGAFDAFIEGGEDWRNFGRIFAQVNNAPGYGAEKMDLFFDPLVLRLINLLSKALPQAKREDLFWGFHFTSGAYTLTLSRTGRIDRLSDGLCSSDDFETIKRRFARFMTAGLRALCDDTAED